MQGQTAAGMMWRSPRVLYTAQTVNQTSVKLVVIS